MKLDYLQNLKVKICDQGRFVVKNYVTNKSPSLCFQRRLQEMYANRSHFEKHFQDPKSISSTVLYLKYLYHKTALLYYRWQISRAQKELNHIENIAQKLPHETDTAYYNRFRENRFRAFMLKLKITLKKIRASNAKHESKEISAIISARLFWIELSTCIKQTEKAASKLQSKTKQH